jgi:hypothetical protein
VFATVLTAVAQLQPTQGTGRRCVAAKLRELRAQREAACATDTFEEHRATYEDMNEEELFDRTAFAQIIADAEADIARVKQLLALTDMAVALNGGSYDKILRFSDSEEEQGT